MIENLTSGGSIDFIRLYHAYYVKLLLLHLLRLKSEKVVQTSQNSLPAPVDPR